jgi:hypothetical protein
MPHQTPPCLTLFGPECLQVRPVHVFVLGHLLAQTVHRVIHLTLHRGLGHLLPFGCLSVVFLYARHGVALDHKQGQQAHHADPGQTQHQQQNPITHRFIRVRLYHKKRKPTMDLSQVKRSATRPTFMFLHLSYCGHCKDAKPAFDAATKALRLSGAAHVCAYEMQAHPRLGEELNVHTFPQFFRLDSGQTAPQDFARHEGGRSAKELTRFGAGPGSLDRTRRQYLHDKYPTRRVPHKAADAAVQFLQDLPARQEEEEEEEDKEEKAPTWLKDLRYNQHVIADRLGRWVDEVHNDTRDVGTLPDDIVALHADAGVYADANMLHRTAQALGIKKPWHTFVEPIVARVYTACDAAPRACRGRRKGR